jgi:hypothetical protein
MRNRCADEGGFAMVLAIALISLLTTIAITLLVVTSGETSRSRADVKRTGAYHAAEAGTNAYLSNLTESTVFFNSFLAKGEATRTDSGNVTHASSNASDVAWTSGTTWTYKTTPTADTGWFDMSNGYDYLIQVYPPNQSVVQAQAQVITRIDVTGRPKGSTDMSTWRTIETMIRPTSLTDFQTFSAASISYGSTATTTGPIFIGENASGVVGTLNHDGTAKANLYAEGSVTGSTTYTNGAKKYDKNTNPTALCKLNNCTPVLFSSFATTFTKVLGNATAGNFVLNSTDNTNAALSGQTPAYHVDAWKLVFTNTGNVLVSSCKFWYGTYNPGSGNQTKSWPDYDTTNQPVCGTAVTKAVPAIGAIYSYEDVLVSGVVKGRVTVASAADIIYQGQLTYNTNGVDVLGLEATGSLQIAQYANTGTLNLWAAEFALNGSFQADPAYGLGASGTMNYNGSSAVYGGIVMSNLFSVRNYNYDTNLKFVQPPFWPTLGNAFTILAQREL